MSLNFILFQLNRIFLISLAIFQLFASVSANTSNYVEITVENWKSAKYNTTYCQDTTHVPSNLITQITASSCVNLYKKKGCHGRFIRFQPLHIASVAGKVVHEWDWGHQRTVSHLVVGSIGPCLNLCDSKNWDDRELKDTVSVTVYDQDGFNGNSSTLLLNENDCTPIPSNLQGLKSVKIVGEDYACISLHSTADCSSGSYAILRPGYPLLNHIYYYRMHPSVQLSAYEAKAISFCGKYCNKEESSNQTVSATKESTFAYSAKVYQRENGHMDLSITFGSKSSIIYTASVNVNGCTNIPFLHQDLRRITSNSAKCLNLYSEVNCQGPVIRWQSSGSDIDEPLSYNWKEDVPQSKVFQLKSVDLCTDKCDASYWEGADLTKEVNVTLFNWDTFRGNKTVLTMKPGDCVPIPLTFTTKSIKFERNDSCIQLHATPHCGEDKYALIRPGYPLLDDIGHYGLDNGYNYVTYTARAVSLCRSFCHNKLEPKAINDPPKEKLKEGSVTYFDYYGYYGVPTNFDLSRGCQNFPESIHGAWGSLWTYGQCVVVYEDKDCEEEYGFTSVLQTSAKSAEYYMEKLTAMTFPVTIKSMRLCNMAEVDPVNTADAEAAHPTADYSINLFWMAGLITVVNTVLSATIGAYVFLKLHTCRS